MNVAPGSAFFQTVQGSAAHTGANAGNGNAVRPVEAAAHQPSVSDRQRVAHADIQAPQQLRQGPPGTNLNIVV